MNQSPIAFIETIRLQEGLLHHLEFHQARVNRTLAHHALPPLSLMELLKSIAPQYPTGLYKCRVLYGQEPPQVEISPYQPLLRQEVRVIEADSIEYPYKYADRTQINELLHRSSAQDVIIIKNGYVTDSAIANLVFESPQGLFTPRLPLLEGVQRAVLLQQQRIIPIDIKYQDLTQFHSVHFINAMVPLGAIAPLSITKLIKHD